MTKILSQPHHETVRTSNAHTKRSDSPKAAFHQYLSGPVGHPEHGGTGPAAPRPDPGATGASQKNAARHPPPSISRADIAQGGQAMTLHSRTFSRQMGPAGTPQAKSADRSPLNDALVEILLYPEGSGYLSECPRFTLCAPAKAPVMQLLPDNCLPVVKGFVEPQLPPGTGPCSAINIPMALPGARTGAVLEQLSAMVTPERTARRTAATQTPASPMRFPLAPVHVHCIERNGNCSIWLRDYQLGASDRKDLVGRVVRAFKETGKVITSITLNGHVIWRRSATDQS